MSARTCAILNILAAALWLLTPAAAAEDIEKILQQQTQELMDAVSRGDASVWEHYLDPSVSYTDESGAVLTKAKLVEQTRPLPANVSGNIKVTEFKVTGHGDVAVATHVDDEHESYHGAELHCQYRTTDTWLKTADGWWLIATQVLALLTDPPAIQLSEQQMKEIAGRYSLGDLIYEIRVEDGHLIGQRHGLPAQEMKAEAPDVLFIPGEPRYRTFMLRDAKGQITGYAERREAWQIVWKRLP